MEVNFEYAVITGRLECGMVLELRRGTETHALMWDDTDGRGVDKGLGPQYIVACGARDPEIGDCVNVNENGEITG